MVERTIAGFMVGRMMLSTRIALYLSGEKRIKIIDFMDFLCHPRSLDRGFQLCILVSHATKSTWQTDPRELDRVNELRDEHAVRNAIAETAKSIVHQSLR